jgi:hypothetical protein
VEVTQNLEKTENFIEFLPTGTYEGGSGFVSEAGNGSHQMGRIRQHCVGTGHEILLS